jgi:hypothetical protein
MHKANSMWVESRTKLKANSSTPPCDFVSNPIYENSSAKTTKHTSMIFWYTYEFKEFNYHKHV